jgi:hypothetical protein
MLVDMAKRFINILPVSQLEKMNTKRLLMLLKSVRAVESAEQRSLKSAHICCTTCWEWMLTKEEYKEMVLKPTLHLTNYKHRIKKILSTRENLKKPVLTSYQKTSKIFE